MSRNITPICICTVQMDQFTLKNYPLSNCYEGLQSQPLPEFTLAEEYQSRWILRIHLKIQKKTNFLMHSQSRRCYLSMTTSGIIP